MRFHFSVLNVLIVCALLLFTVSCSDENDETFEPKYLTEYQEIISLSRNSILEMLSENEYLPAEVSFIVTYGVKAIRITYKTQSLENETVLASGLLLIPEVDSPVPLLSFQHGTITEDSSAPSNFQSVYSDLATIISSSGYIITLPDYLGYGSSSEIDHPYEHRATLATSCRDMLRASYEFFKVKGTNQPNHKLFLSGYSEGGFATMATFKLLQEEHSDEFDVTAVTVGAGAYNKTAFANYIVNANEDLLHINSFVWVLDVYNTLYSDLNRPYSYYFNEPWASTIANYGVFSTIEGNPQSLFTSSFLESYKSGNDLQLASAFADNDCYHWKPNSPMQMYHGTSDIYVPYFNSQTAYEAMRALGATDVELITIEGGDHSTVFADYALGTLVYFQGFLSN